ncbi:MAG: PAS domain S-box protein [Candidatus Marinimicrobia bacterium]|nr:PAS domain S-box protein [Candidatus Neomarinimicrobiota bacterium]
MLWPSESLNYKFRRLSVTDGLSQSSIYSIHQDKYGYMWFGTEDGLNKYDGYDIKVYRHIFSDENSLNDNTIYSIAESEDGYLWLGTHSGGLNQFNLNNGNVTHYLIDPNDKSSLTSNYIYKVLVNPLPNDEKYELWIGTDYGLNRFNPETGNVIRYMHQENDINSIPDNDVQELFIDHSGILWIGTLYGLSSFNPEDQTFTNYYSYEDDDDGLPGNMIYDIYEDRGGLLWICTDGGLVTFNQLSGQFININLNLEMDDLDPSHLVINVIQDHNGIFWLGTLAGLYYYDADYGKINYFSSDPLNPYSLVGNYLMDIFEDNSHLLWLGTRSDGINYFDPGNNPIDHFEFSDESLTLLSSKSVYSIFTDKNGIIWYGSDGNGLISYNPYSNKYIQYLYDEDDDNSISSNIIFHIIQDGYGVMWVATDWGLNRFKPESNNFERFLSNPDNPQSLGENAVFHMTESETGILWLATYGGGLNKFNSQRGIFTRYENNLTDGNSIQSNYLNCIFIDDHGIIWSGSDSGLEIFNPKTGIFNHQDLIIDNTINFVNNPVYIIYQDDTHTMWFGTQSGLFKYDYETQDLINYRIADGLPNETINGILEDSSRNLWISTNSGISKYNMDNNKFINFDIMDGLQSNEFNAGAIFKTSKGKMYFGGVNGVSSFYPHLLEHKDYTFPVYITKSKTNSNALDNNNDNTFENFNNDSIVLDYSNDFLSIEFLAIDFRASSKITYSYKLDGFDDQYQFIGPRRIANYTNLHPGRYTFKVKCLNSDLSTNNEADAFTIVITPPVWEKLWFRITAGMFFIILIYLYIEYRIRKVKRQKTYLKKIVDEGIQKIDKAKVKEISALNKLEIEKKYLEDLFHGSVDAIAMTNNVGKIIQVNIAFINLFGYSEEEAIGSIIDDLLTDQKRQIEAKKISEDISAGTRVSVETIRYKKNGSLVHVVIEGIPVLFKEGQLGIWGIYRDISEKHQAEEDISDKMTRLENMNKFMTGREKKMMELKQEVNEISLKFGLPSKYNVSD